MLVYVYMYGCTKRETMIKQLRILVQSCFNILLSFEKYKKKRQMSNIQILYIFLRCS